MTRPDDDVLPGLGEDERLMRKLHPEPLPHPAECAALAPDGVPSDTGEEYDWRDSGDTIVEQQPATAVYLNGRGQTVVRQYRTGFDAEDQFVFFSVEALPKLIAELQRYIEPAVTPVTPPVTPHHTVTKRDTTAAEGKRRQCERRRTAAP